MAYTITTNEKEQAPVLGYIAKFLLDIGITPSLKGFQLFRNAVFLYILDSERFSKPKILYEMLADMHGDCVDSIKSNMRNSIRQALYSGKLLKLNNIMGVKMLDKDSSISNLQLISIIAEFIRYS